MRIAVFQYRTENEKEKENRRKTSLNNEYEIFSGRSSIGKSLKIVNKKGPPERQRSVSEIH